jgi:hypothetical protein
MNTYGWVDGERVPLAMPAEAVWPMLPEEEEAGSEADRSGAWWPSESVRRVRLVELSRGQAAQVSDWARQELVYWLAGDGLHPLRWMRRWTMALWRYAPEVLPSGASTMFGADVIFERAALGALFPRAGAAGEKARLDGVWRGLGDRCQVRVIPTGRLECLESGCRPLEGCDWDGPLVDRDAAEEEAGEVARLALGNLVRWLAADGGWCLGALKRFYVAIFVEYRDLAPKMTGEDWGAIYGQTRAAFCEDAKRYVGLPLEAELGYRPKVAGQKRNGAEAYAANAAEHCPRRQVGPVNHTEEDKRSHSREDEARLARVRAAAEERERERDAAAMEEIARGNRERGRGKVLAGCSRFQVSNDPGHPAREKDFEK